MLNRLDDFLIHQTAEPIAHPVTSDRNAYDRVWYNGYALDGSWYFGIGMAVYPHRGILDCAFSVVESGGRQHCFFGSRRAPVERTEMEVGPFRLEILEPFRRSRIVLADNESGVSCSLTFSARTAGIEEAHQTLWNGTRRAMDATRWDQFGRWSGEIRHPDGAIRVHDDQCRGTKDRSWGVRPVGERESGGAPAIPSGLFFLWAPLFWDDHITHAIFFDDPQGRPLVREGIVAPLYESEKAIPPGAEDGRDERMATVRHRVRYHPDTRLAASAEIDLFPLEGDIRTVHLEPILKFQMKGLGYAHPEWGQGMWKNELAVGGESFDPLRLDPLAPENIHVQQVVKATDGSRHGIGVLEQALYGPYRPHGFAEFFDGAKGV